VITAPHRPCTIRYFVVGSPLLWLSTLLGIFDVLRRLWILTTAYRNLDWTLLVVIVDEDVFGSKPARYAR
jgi:hypothetical protein